jgi:hypothetical protein
MSKDKKRNSQPTVAPEITPTPDTVPGPSQVAAVPNAPVPVPVSLPAPKLFLAEVDKMALDLAKEQRKTALAEAKTALANNEKAELTFKYVVLQLYMKYGLTDRDAISEQGEIIKNGAVRQAQG